MSGEATPDAMLAAARERQAEILDKGPRIPPLEVEELSDELADMVMRMVAINEAIDSRQTELLTDLMAPEAPDGAAPDLAALIANLPEIMRTMLRHPALFSRQADMGIQLLVHGVLPARDRELAILRVGWLCRAPYEWGEHTLIAKKAGVTSEEITRVTLGSAAPGWSAHDAAILRAVEELRTDAMISDATWAVLAERYDERQLIELPSLVGQYQAVAYYQNSLRLRLHEGNDGLAAR